MHILRKLKTECTSIKTSHTLTPLWSAFKLDREYIHMYVYAKKEHKKREREREREREDPVTTACIENNISQQEKGRVHRIINEKKRILCTFFYSPFAPLFQSIADVHGNGRD
jgi:hypothetical protein